MMCGVKCPMMCGMKVLNDVWDEVSNDVWDEGSMDISVNMLCVYVSLFSELYVIFRMRSTEGSSCWPCVCVLL